MSRWIDADEIENAKFQEENLRGMGEHIAYRVGWNEAIESILENAPSIEIIRCQDCKYWVYNFNGCSRNPCTEPWYATDFCSYGCNCSEKPNNCETCRFELYCPEMCAGCCEWDSHYEPKERSSE